jgi:toxin-antitoxin system PIN domain toxin
LIDLNVWLALVIKEHFHHEAAMEKFARRGEGKWFFCRATQKGLLRLLSQAATTGGYPVPMRQCWSIYDGVIAERNIGFLDEPDGLEQAWRKLTMLPLASPKLWMDAYLQAFAQLADVKILTFDRALAQAAGGEWLEV